MKNTMSFKQNLKDVNTNVVLYVSVPAVFLNFLLGWVFLTLHDSDFPDPNESLLDFFFVITLHSFVYVLVFIVVHVMFLYLSGGLDDDDQEPNPPY